MNTFWQQNQNQPDVTARNAITRLDLLADAAEGKHAVADCGWKRAALEVLELNGIKEEQGSLCGPPLEKTERWE